MTKYLGEAGTEFVVEQIKNNKVLLSSIPIYDFTTQYDNIALWAIETVSKQPLSTSICIVKGFKSAGHDKLKVDPNAYTVLPSSIIRHLFLKRYSNYEPGQVITPCQIKLVGKFVEGGFIVDNDSGNDTLELDLFETPEGQKYYSGTKRCDAYGIYKSYFDIPNGGFISIGNLDTIFDRDFVLYNIYVNMMQNQELAEKMLKNSNSNFYNIWLTVYFEVLNPKTPLFKYISNDPDNVEQIYELFNSKIQTEKGYITLFEFFRNSPDALYLHHFDDVLHSFRLEYPTAKTYIDFEIDTDGSIVHVAGDLIDPTQFDSVADVDPNLYIRIKNFGGFDAVGSYYLMKPGSQVLEWNIRAEYEKNNSDPTKQYIVDWNGDAYYNNSYLGLLMHALKDYNESAVNEWAQQ